MLARQIAQHPLVAFLCDPVTAGPALNAGAWNTLLRDARRSNLLCKAACQALDLGMADQLPPKIRFHFRSAERVALSGRLSAQREIQHVERALASAGIACVLLKGAAYVAMGLATGKGRLMTDVDIMVPRERLRDAEIALVQAGWVTTKINAYDQRYYRQWMHELPPMRHRDRGTSLDIHHTILPPTARLKPDVDLLWKDARHAGESSGLRVLSPSDMVLHSAAHLFHEGEFANGLRDLFDIDALLREFSGDPDFWSHLLARAGRLDLDRPLYYALRCCSQLLATALPASARSWLALHAPPYPMRKLMDHLVTQSLGSVLALAPRPVRATALFAMYVRSHYLRMPMHLLLPHLVRKQFGSDAR